MGSHNDASPFKAFEPDMLGGAFVSSYTEATALDRSGRTRQTDGKGNAIGHAHRFVICAAKKPARNDYAGIRNADLVHTSAHSCGCDFRVVMMDHGTCQLVPRHGAALGPMPVHVSDGRRVLMGFNWG
jgi:hypothetical protein